MSFGRDRANAATEHDGKLISLALVIAFTAGCAVGIGLTWWLAC